MQIIQIASITHLMMVSHEEVQSTNDEFFRNRSLVAVLIGATSGIGEYTARAMATLYGKHTASLRLYIVGRNGTAAQKIMSECSRLCPNGSFQFVKAGDLASIKEVDRVSNELLGIEQQQNRDSVPRIDFLMMTQGQVVFGPRRGLFHFPSPTCGNNGLAVSCLSDPSHRNHRRPG